jgi:hypothetical protein
MGTKMKKGILKPFRYISTMMGMHNNLAILVQLRPGMKLDLNLFLTFICVCTGANLIHIIIEFCYGVSTDAKEAEMQIGFPTDVKHVAHIGWDGPSATANNPAVPNWVSRHKPRTK